MSVKPFVVASYETGKETDMEPWLLPEEAMPEIYDAYVWRKRVVRRGGNDFLGRITQEAIQTYPLAVSGVAPFFSNAGLEVIENLPISPNSVTITINTLTFTDDGNGNIITAGMTVGTINYFNGIFGVNFTAIGGGPYNVTIEYSFYPNLPAMGLCTKENFQITVQDLIAFNTQKADIYNAATQYFDDISFYDHSDQPVTWTGADYDFFDSENYQFAFFASNNTPGYHFQNIVNIVAGATTVTITFAANELVANDVVFLTGIVGTGALPAALNNMSFIVTSATQTTITLTVTTTGTYSSGGTAFLLQHSGFDVAQPITAITSISATDTRITFASNALTTGNNVYIQWVNGTMGAVLNNLDFTVIASGTTTIDINVNTTGLTYTSGGIVFRPVLDGIRWYADDTNVNGWVNFNPPLNGVSVLTGARLIVGYKDRLVVLNTFEGIIGTVGSSNYPNRARWSQNGTCFYAGSGTSALPVNQTADPLAWRDDIPGRGGFIDAPTTENIIGCEFIRDTLLVFFERSTWALRYTTNEALPFVWVRVNVEFGSLCQMSSIPFDRGVLAIGNRGIITSDGNNVERIDLKIPYTLFDFSFTENDNARVQGIRDYYNELVYWTFLTDDAASTTIYPNRVLVYNYRENSYSLFNDSYTCFGYYTESQPLLWNTCTNLWNRAAFTWNSAQSSVNFPSIVAGTNTGYVMILPNQDNPDTGNDIQISIAGITNGPSPTVTTHGNHNLDNYQYYKASQYVMIENVQGMTQINGLISAINVTSANTFQLVSDVDTTSYGTYLYGGDVIRVNNFSIWTKQFNPFVSEASSIFMNRLDVYSDWVENGQIAINCFANGNTTTPLNLAGPGEPQFWQLLLPLDETGSFALPVDKTWCRLNTHIRGQFIQLQFTMNDAQMLDSTTNLSPFVLHGFILWMGKAGRIISR